MSELEALRILLVDDNQDDRILAIRELKRAHPNLQITEISNPDGFEAELKTRDFGAVITDFQLGWSTGVDVLRRVRAVKPNCPVVMFTATASQEDAVKAMKAGLDDYVLKSPKQYARLPSALLNAVRHREAIQAASDAEARLREREAWFSSTLRYIGAGIITADAGGRLQSMNPEAERLTGWRAEDALGRDVDDVLHLLDSQGQPLPESRSRTVMRERATSVDLERDFLVVRRDGFKTPVIDGAFPLFLDQHRFAGVAITLRDITERKLIESELLRSNEDLQRFAYAVSHDLQEPLRTMSILAELLNRQLERSLTGEQKDLLCGIQSAATRMSAQVKGLLEYGRLTRDGSAVSNFPLEEAINTAVSNAQAYIAERNGRVTCGALTVVHAGRVQMATVFQNLIVNGLKYNSNAKPYVHISIAETEGGRAVSVEDNGIGIPARDRERVFGLFVRLAPERDNGTGIGLALVKTLVERSGGRIWIDPAYVGGTRFLLTVPMVATGANA